MEARSFAECVAVLTATLAGTSFLSIKSYGSSVGNSRAPEDIVTYLSIYGVNSFKAPPPQHV